MLIATFSIFNSNEKKPEILSVCSFNYNYKIEILCDLFITELSTDNKLYILYSKEQTRLRKCNIYS